MLLKGSEADQGKLVSEGKGAAKGHISSAKLETFPRGAEGYGNRAGGQK